MSAATIPVSWAGLEELTIPAPPPISPPAPPVSTPHTSCTLQSVIYGLYSIIQTEEGRDLAPLERVRAMGRIKAAHPGLAAIYGKQVVGRMNVPPAKRDDALTALVRHLFRAVSGEVAEQLAAVDFLLNRGVYTGTMETHLTKLRGIWDECSGGYPATLSADERAIYEALGDAPDEQATFRIMRDLAITGKGEFFLGCDQLKHRLGSGCNGWRLLQQFQEGGYGIIAKSKDGARWEKGVKPRAASWKWRLPLPTAVPQTQ